MMYLFHIFIIAILSKFRTNLLAANHLIIWEGIKLDIEKKPLNALLEIVTLVTSANNIGSYIEFIQRKVIYIYYEQQRP